MRKSAMTNGERVTIPSCGEKLGTEVRQMLGESEVSKVSGEVRRRGIVRQVGREVWRRLGGWCRAGFWSRAGLRCGRRGAVGVGAVAFLGRCGYYLELGPRFAGVTRIIGTADQDRYQANAEDQSKYNVKRRDFCWPGWHVDSLIIGPCVLRRLNHLEKH